MTLEGNHLLNVETEPASAAGTDQVFEEKQKRRVGILIALIGALMIAISASDALPGSAWQNRSTGSEARDAMYGTSEDEALLGGNGDDEIFGGPGRDVLVGGPGDDFVDASDREQDRISCGPGRDAVVSDGRDHIAKDCELLYLN